METVYSKAFKKDFKKLRNQKNIDDLLSLVVDLLIRGQKLPKEYENHKLHGFYKKCYECHIKPDLLLIYQLADNAVFLTRIGSHANLFSKKK